MNILFIGDPHFKTKNVEYIPLFKSRILEIVEKNKPKWIVVAGDLLDNHDRIDVEPLNLALDFIDCLRKCTKVFILVGNHDYKNNQQFLTENHWMNALKKWENVVIVDEVVETDKFIFVPYVPPGRFIEALETKINIENISQYKCVFAHQEFFGCKMGAIESKVGDVWNAEWPLVVSGHIHNKQWCQENIYYPGSAMQHAFGQSVENTISLLNFFQEFTFNEIDLNMPKLKIKYLSIQDVLKPLKFEITEFKKYKIVISGTLEEFQTFKKNSRYQQLLSDGFKIIFKVKNVKMTPINNNKNTKNFLTLLGENINKENNLDLGNLYKKYCIQ